MKRLISAALALVFALSAMLSVSLTAYSATKKYAEQELELIQKKSGFIPGKTSSVTGNCYGFVADVCEQLYGKTYNGEGLYNSYQCKHSTGNYYTVATLTTGTDPNASAKSIKEFFINNAYPGDIVHYGSLNSSSSTHTIMIQSVDKEKMRIFHSNYPTKENARETCHIDTIYWASFLSDPTKTAYTSSGRTYSMNGIFSYKMKNGGLGITINRYSKYNTYFYAPVIAVPQVTATRSSSTGIKLSWNAVGGVSRYEVQYKKSSDTVFSSITASCTSCSYNIANLKIGTKYDFRVRGYYGGKWTGFSEVVSKKVLPPTVSSVKFTPESAGLKLSWAKKTDLTGVRIYKDGALLKELSGTASAYTDKSVEYGEDYSYKVERFVKSGETEYKTTSSAFTGKYLLTAPQITYERNSADSITFFFNGDNYQDVFDYSVSTPKNSSYINKTSIKESSVELTSLELGEKYTVKCRERTQLGAGEWTSLTVQAVNKAVEDVKTQPNCLGISISFSSQKDADGYAIYRSESPVANFLKIAETTSAAYLDDTIEYNTRYYYSVRAFSKYGTSVLYGELSKVTESVANKLSKASGFKVLRKSPTAVTVKWSPVSYASSYEIKYKAEGGKWTSILTSKTSKTISKLDTGVKYTFKVRAVNKKGKGAFTSSKTMKVLPPKPEQPSVKSGKRGIKISWTAQKYAKGYYIYRATSKNGKYALVKTVYSGKTSNYTDCNVRNNRKYYYKVACFVKKNGREYKSSKSAASVCKFTK